MNRRTIPVLILAVFLAVVLAAFPAAAESYTAGAMRLLRYDGDVEILSTEGVPRFVMENVRFDSGEAMHTGEASSASVGLDDTKIVTLDANTRVQFLQEDSHIRLNLTEGAIFVDVSEKLDENESFDIQTTTMTVGIRGTLIFVTAGVSASASAGVNTAPATSIGVLEGAGRVEITDKSGTRRVFDVPAGKKVTLNDSAESEAAGAPVITNLAPADLNNFVGDVIRGSEDLTNRVIDGSPEGELLLSGSDDEGSVVTNPHPAGGDWVWADEVRLVAQSASKLYDGHPLRRASGVLVYGLPADCSIKVSSEGSRTDAGTADNVIRDDYAIFNSVGENVTSHFTNIVKVAGVLRVDPAPLTVWTGSAEKVYDGEPLTCAEAEIRTVPGHVMEEPAWRNTSIVTRSALGTESMVGVSGSVWVHGTNPLTGEVREVMLGTGQRLSVSLTNENGTDSIAFTVEDLKVEDIPGDVLQMYAQNPDLMAQALEDTGWDPEKLQERVNSLQLTGENTVKQNGLAVPAGAEGDVMTDSSNVRIHIDSNVTDYNTRPLTEDEAHFAPVTLDPSIRVTATGSQTGVGESENTYEVDWGNADKNNYEIIFDPGKLTVTPLELDVNIGGGSAAYSGGVFSPNPSITYLNGAHAGERVTGTRHSAEAAVSDTSLNSSMMYDFLLFTGDTVTLTISGMGSEPGTYTLSGSVRVASENGGSVSASYSNATVTIEPAVLSIYTGSATKKYDGKPLTCSQIEVTGLVGGETVRVAAAGSQTEVGSSRNTYTFWWDTANPDHYTVREHLGTLEVTESKKKATVTITGAKVTEMYTGEEFQAEGFEVSVDNDDYSVEDFIFEGRAFAKGTVPGTYKMGLKASQFKNTNKEFDVTFKVTDGSLVVTKSDKLITFTAPSGTKAYDGKPLTVEEDGSDPSTWVKVDGLDDEYFWAYGIAEGSRTTVGGEGAGDNKIVEYMIGDRSSEERVVTEYFTNIQLVPGDLVVTPNGASIIITAGSGQKEYDGTPLKEAGFLVTGLPFEGLRVEATTSGSQTEVGTGTNTVASYKILDADGKDVTNCFSNVTTSNGELKVTALSVTVSITGNNDTATYDGNEHTVSGYTFESDSALYTADDFTYEGQAVIRETSADTHMMNLDPDKFVNRNGNFTATFTIVEDGFLDISPLAVTVTVTGASDTRTYTGEMQSVEGWTWESSSDLYPEEPGDIALLGTAVASGKNAGTYWMGLGSDLFENMDGNFDVTFQVTDGYLTITKATLSVTTQDITRTYNGSPLPIAGDTENPPDIDGLLGTDTASVSNKSGQRTDAGSISNDYSIEWGEEEDKNNYDIDATLGTLTVSPKKLIVTTGDADKVFDGMPLTQPDGASLAGLVDGQTATITATGSRTHVYDDDTNTYEIAWGSASSGNYELEENLGTLTVTSLPVDLEGLWHRQSNTYDLIVTCSQTNFVINRIDSSTWQVVWTWADSSTSTITVSVTGSNTFSVSGAYPDMDVDLYDEDGFDFDDN